MSPSRKIGANNGSGPPSPQESHSHVDSVERLRALRQYDILDTEPEPAFETIADLAAHLLDVPIALVNFIEKDRQWFKSAIGIDERETGLDVSVCVHTIASEGVTVVEDLSEDERFSDNPYVTEKGLQFYAGAPLVTPNGYRVGTLCAIDTSVREPSDEQLERLVRLADLVIDELELRQENKAHEEAEEALRRNQKRYESLFEAAEEAILVHDLNGQIVRANTQAQSLFESAEGGLKEMSLFDLHPPEAREVPRQKLNALKNERSYRVVTEYVRSSGERFWGHLSASAVKIEGEVVVRSMIRDITSERRAERLERVQRRLFEQIASGETLETILSRIANFTEEELPGRLVSILTKQEGRLWHAAGPSLPSKYVKTINGIKVESGAGSCGTAAHHGLEVVTEDILEDPRWDGYREPAVDVGIRSCWSWPISGAEGDIYGTFAVYGQDPGRPGNFERKLLRRMAHVASVAIARKRDTVELRERKEVLETIFESVPVMIAFFDGKGVPQLLNSRVQSVLGWTKEESVGTLELFDKLFPDEKRRQEALEFVRNPSGEWREFQLQTAEGEQLPVRVTTVALTGDRRIAIGLDVSEKKQREQRLRLMEAAVKHSQVPILITQAEPLDEPGPRIEYVNPAFKMVTGYEQEEIRGRNPRILQGPDTDEEVLSRIRDALEADEPVREIVRNYRKDGTEYWNDIYIAPVRGESGDVTHYVSIQDDATERVRREQQLETAKHEAEQASRLKSALLSNMSHEFRTPLTSIISFGELIENSPDLASEFASRIVGGGKRLLRTLNTVMDFAELEAGGAAPNPRAFDVRDVISAVTSEFREDAERHGLKLKTEQPSAPLMAVLDPHQVERICIHLVENAVKFTDDGVVTVGLEDSFEDEDEEALVLWVEDTGIGIDPEFVPHAFDEFTQASTGASRTHEGNGLGLTVVKRFARGMGGSVHMESMPGEGTRVSVQLPASIPPQRED